MRFSKFMFLFNKKLFLTRVLHIGVHIGAVLPLLWLVVVGIPEGRLGGDPVEELTHFLGKGAIHLLFLTLCVSPLAKKLKMGQLMRLRRPLGLWCFVWASLHFSVWIVLDLQFYWGLIGEEIVERNYLLVGFTAWLILLVLAVTSVPSIMRAMRARWKKLHSWIYLVAVLAPVHYLWAVKSGVIEPGIYLAIALGLLWLRRDRLLKLFRPLYSRLAR
jgi:methionine sulfoxide reductase heme-binding subunit